LKEIYWVVGALALIAGFLFLFCGLALIKGVVFIAGFVLTTMVVLILFYGTFMASNTAVWAFWTIIGCSALVGCGIGALMVWGIRFGAAILCAWGGFMLGLIINEMWLYIYGSLAVFWTTSILVAIACGVAAFIVFEPAVILMTAFLGSYFMCRGLSMFVGGFPSAFEVTAMVKQHAFSTIDPVFYGYLAGMVLLTILGFFVQWKLFKKKDDK
jgi:hypothetical protein